MPVSTGLEKIRKRKTRSTEAITIYLSDIPRLQAGNQSFTSGHLDTYLTTKFESSKARQAKADELAYVSLAHKLYQLTLHSCFRVGSNWTHMRSLFCAQYSFPSNLLVARQVAHRAQIQLLGSGFEDDIEIPAELQELSDEPSALLNGKEIDDIVKAQLEARLQRRLKAKAAFDKQKVRRLPCTCCALQLLHH